MKKARGLAHRASGHPSSTCACSLAPNIPFGPNAAGIPPEEEKTISEKAETNHRNAVYTIIERGEDQKPRWVRIGIAFVSRDGSLNVILDAVPVSGKLHVRDFREREEGVPRRSEPVPWK